MKIVEEGIDRLVLARSPEDEASGTVERPGDTWSLKNQYYFGSLHVPARVVIHIDRITKHVAIERETLWPWGRHKRIAISHIDLVGTEHRVAKWTESRGPEGTSRDFRPPHWEVHLLCSSGRPVQIAKGRDWGQIQTIAEKVGTLIGKKVEYNYKRPKGSLGRFIDKMRELRLRWF